MFGRPALELSNMNVNKVNSNRAIQLTGGKLDSKNSIHSNDDMNMFCRIKPARLARSKNPIYPNDGGNMSQSSTTPSFLHLCILQLCSN